MVVRPGSTPWADARHSAAVLGDASSEREPVPEGIDNRDQAGTALGSLFSSLCSGRLHLRECRIQIGDVKAQPALAFLIGSAAVQGDRRVSPMELTPERRLEIDSEADDVPVEPHGLVFTATR